MNDRWIVTGNQDKTARVYDRRRVSECLFVIPGLMSAFRNCQLQGGRLVCAESCDFVHVVDLVCQRQQTIDFFGEIAGVSMFEDELYVGNADSIYGSILEFDARNSHAWPE